MHFVQIAQCFKALNMFFRSITKNLWRNDFPVAQDFFWFALCFH